MILNFYPTLLRKLVAQLKGALPSGVCRSEYYRFEFQLAHFFLPVEFTLYVMSLPHIFSISSPHW